MERSHFIRSLALGTGALFVRPLWAMQPQPKGQFFDLNRGAGYFTFRGGTIGWYKDKDVLVMIDSQFADTAPVFADQFIGTPDRQIDVLFNTHHHGDHTGGNKVLRTRVTRIVAQQQVPVFQKKQAEQRNAVDQIAVADQTFDKELKLKLGKETFRLKHVGPAHSAGDTIIHLERANVAHMGDLVFNRMPAVIDRSSGANVEAWINVLEKAHRGFDRKTRLIYGHGNPAFGVTGSKDDLLVMRDFFAASLAWVDKAIAGGMSREGIVALEKVPGFDQHYREDRKDAVGRMLGLIWDERKGIPAVS